jgi:hypothetical protein
MSIVFLNKWEGDKFQNGIACDNCGVEGTVALICDKKICAICLHEAIEEINEAVLKAACDPEKARRTEAHYQ